MASHSERDGRYLWSFLLNLGFTEDPEGNKSHVIVGEHMFNKPNKDALYIVIYFLFKKLNPSRTSNNFRHCWPVLDRKQDAEFRKLALAWLQEIKSEEGASFPWVQTSALMTPWGPKIKHILFCLAKHTLHQHIKTLRTDGSWNPTGITVPASSAVMVKKRHLVGKTRYITALKTRETLSQERQQRARSWETSIRQLKAERKTYEKMLEGQQGADDVEESSLLEKADKVRHLWAEVEKTLSMLSGHRRAMDQALSDDVDKYTLDGNAMNVNIPKSLKEKPEIMAQLASREALCQPGQPSLFPLLELLNQALAVLNDERDNALGPTAELREEASLIHDAEVLEKTKTCLPQMLKELMELRAKLTAEDIPQTRGDVMTSQQHGYRKWVKPPASDIQTLGLLPPMAPLCFDASPEDQLISGPHLLFLSSLAPAARPDTEKAVTKGEEDHVRQTPRAIKKQDGPCLIPSPSIPSSDEDLESEEIPTTTPIMPCVVESTVPASPFLKPQRRSLYNALKETPPSTCSKRKPESDCLTMELDNLAEQFAQAVVCSPEGNGEGAPLDDLLKGMIEPFSVRKELPRTPESLIEDVRTSWRKAVEESATQKVCPSKKFPDSFTGCFTPFSGAGRAGLSTDMSSIHTPIPPSFSSLPLETPKSALDGPTGTSPTARNTTFDQQESAIGSSTSPDSSHMVASNSQNSNDPFLCSIAQESMPELSSCDSSFCSDNGLQGNSNEGLGEDLEENGKPPTQFGSLLQGDKEQGSPWLHTLQEKAGLVSVDDHNLMAFSPVIRRVGQGVWGD